MRADALCDFAVFGVLRKAGYAFFAAGAGGGALGSVCCAAEHTGEFHAGRDGRPHASLWQRIDGRAAGFLGCIFV